VPLFVLENKGPAKSTPEFSNGAALLTRNSGNAACCGFAHALLFHRLHIRHVFIARFTSCLPFAIQYFDLS
jgi:hypothetical protein